MIFDEAGTYQIEYTATDDCGNETVAERTVIVEEPPTYRTVLYTDGTFIINESSRDEAANIQAHGQPTNVYAPFDPNGATDTDKYIFTSANSRPWNAQASSIKSVEVGYQIQPSDTKYWFDNLTICENIDLSNLDTSLVTDMKHMFRRCRAITSIGTLNTSSATNMEGMFYGCSALLNIDMSGFDTSHVTTMLNMFRDCTNIPVLDLSAFDTSSLLNSEGMFQNCGQVTTIYASQSFVTSQITSSGNMFYSNYLLVGGAGTVFDQWDNPKDKTYAHIDGGTSDPGYFTAKS